MYYITERNERRSRRSAFVLAVMLHLGLAAAVYLATTESPKPAKAEPTKKFERQHPKAFDPRTAQAQP